MKMIFCALFILMGAVSLQASAVTEGGGYDHDNGGDMCENRFNSVRADLGAWILKGAAKDLRLPVGVSYEMYSGTMLEKMQTAKVACVDEKIFVGSAEKTCKNFTDSSGMARIQCNSSRFMSTSESNQFVLVHHEYAGLAGFELNLGEKSNYQISNQISRGLVDLRLQAVRATLLFLQKVANMSEQVPKDRSKKNNSMCMFIGRMNDGATILDLYRELVSMNFPDSDKLRTNLKGLSNYCTEGIFEEDPRQISFEDVLALQIRIFEIQKQLLDVESFLDQRFPSDL